ncbi:MAG: phosphoserine phosphatase SerB [Chloroflexota bacterium]
MHEIILVNITGRDRPGLITRFTGVLADYGVTILDIGESVIHNYISLAMLIEIPSESLSSSVLKDLLYTAHELEITIDFTPINIDEYEDWVSEQGKERRIITIMGRRLTAQQISQVTAVIAKNGLNVDLAIRLSGRMSLRNPAIFPRAAVEFFVSGAPHDDKEMRRQLLEVSLETGVDISFHLDDVYRRNRRIVVFDMDSTLIQAEVINELAKVMGVGDEVTEITAAAMRGELDFQESLRRRVALLEGLSEERLAEIAMRIPLTEGTERLTSTLKELGYKIGIISGGFTYFGHYFQKMLGFDYVFANTLEIKGGKLTGQVVGDIVDGPAKARILQEIAEKEGLKLQQTIAVGDGANDLPMLSVAGLGIAFRPKPIVRKQAEGAISSVGLDGLLYLIGIRDREVLTK